MRGLIVALICAATMTAQAQVPVTPQMLMPSPLGIVIMVGQWLFQDNKRVYYIRVRGEGPNFVTARQNAFRLAVEQAVGTLVLSETQVQNSRIVRDEIITYASGFVDRFTIVDADYVNGVNRVTMDVWVSESKIANRLLNESVGTGTIDGNRLATQVETLQHERVSGDRILETVLRDFPRRAFNVRVERTQVDFSTQRNLQLDVPYVMSWDESYLESFNESLRRTGTDKVTCWWPTPDCTRRERRQYTINGVAFDDEIRPTAVIKHMAIQAKPAVEMNILDAHGRVLAKYCQLVLFSNIENQPYNIPNRYMFMVGNNFARVDRSYVVNGRFSLNFGTDATNLRTAQQIEMRIIPENECARR